MAFKIFFLFGLIASSLLYSQKEIPSTVKYGTKDPPATVYPKEPLMLSSDPNHIYIEVEKLAEYPGGINAFRNKFANKFDTSKIMTLGKVRTELAFVVNKDGNITDVKAEGGNKLFKDEAIRTIKTIKEVWIPAEIKGQAVRYRYRLPVAFSF